jgi:hypothetical protein
MKKKRELWRAVIFPVLGYFRKRRGQFILARYPDIGSMRICDLGGSEHFWDKVELPVSRGNITLYNITPNETQPVAEVRGDRCRLVLYDGDRVPVDDGGYDLCQFRTRNDARRAAHHVADASLRLPGRSPFRGAIHTLAAPMAGLPAGLHQPLAHCRPAES